MPCRNPLLAVLGFLASTPTIHGQSTPALTTLNSTFRAAYADAKIRALALSGPVLIVNGDHFALVRNGQRIEANVAASVYDPVKTIAHIPLAIYVILTPGEGAIEGGRLKTLADLGELIPPAQASLHSQKLSTATLARQKRIVTASLAFLADVTGKRRVERSMLLEFTRGMAPLVMENVTEAARAQLDATHAQVSAWRSDLSAKEWNQMHVLITGPHMAREDLVVMQYFLRLLNEPREGRRVIYAESLWEEPKALDLLATHLLDASVGEAFFGDGLRMHSDLLGEAAKAYLPHLLPQ